MLFTTSLIVLVWAQIRARRFHPALYWATIVASTTAGTTLADFADRSLGIGYPGGSLLLFACVIASLFAWYRSLGTVDVASIATPRAEAYYWITITFSQTLGTALGDWVADSGPGYSGGALIFSAALAVLAALYYLSSVSRVGLFWVHPDPATRRDDRRLHRQTGCQGRARIQPAACLGRPSGSHHRAYPASAAACWTAPGDRNGYTLMMILYGLAPLGNIE